MSQRKSHCGLVNDLIRDNGEGVKAFEVPYWVPGVGPRKVGEEQCFKEVTLGGVDTRNGI